MNQAETLKAVAVDCGLPMTTVEHVLKSVARITEKEMKLEGGEVVLPGIGRLKEHTTAERNVRNPQTGEPILVPPKNTIKLHIAKAMKDAIA